MKTDFSIKIGNRIKHFRELSGLTQLELSALVDCEPSTLAHYETGKNLVSMTKLQKIAAVLNVEPYLFLIFDDFEKDNDKLQSLVSLISKADKVQLGLLYEVIQSVLELNPIK